MTISHVGKIHKFKVNVNNIDIVVDFLGFSFTKNAIFLFLASLFLPHLPFLWYLV